jgi:hypothetical protein
VFFAFPFLGAYGHLRAEASKVTIGLQGRISPKCSLSDMTGKLDFGSVGGTGRANRSAAVDFTIDCNTPFIYRLSAQEGAMRLQGSGPAPSAAHIRLPYDISLIIPTDDGGTMRAGCGSEALSTDASGRGCNADSGQAIATHRRGQILVSLRSGPKLPRSGNYTDNLEIGLSVKE